MSTTASSPAFTDIIVVVHGIGSQMRASTVRSVATRLAGSKTLLTGGSDHPVAPQPLGYFHADAEELTAVRLVDDASVLKGTGLAGVGVAEVFWADIPEKADDDGSTLEETKAWARTVVARAQALCNRARRRGTSGIVPPDFHLAAEVLEEIVDTVQVMENLCVIAEKAGLFQFALGEVLEDYLGDVQIVAEFGDYRADIVGRFRKVMEDIFERHVKQNGNIRLHIVAHSEGTVVSLLGLLEALSGRTPATPAPGFGEANASTFGKIPQWLKHLHGYMTIGSPIDKHLLLWPRLWENFNPSFANQTLPAGQIRWRNYYDYGDPVGFKLETARHWLDLKNAQAFQFCGCPECRHDIGFARYLFPGKAHNDYWDDAEVFEHFIRAVVKPDPKPPEPPASRPNIAWLSPLFPYVLSFLILLGGVFVLYKAVGQFTHPERDPLQEIFLIQTFGLVSEPGVSGWTLFQHTLAIAILIAGTTAFARLPRLAVGFRWKLAGFGAFFTGCAAYVFMVDEASRNEIGRAFQFAGPHGPTAGVLAVAFVVGLIALLLARSPKDHGEDRRQWLLRRGMRPLLMIGALGIAVIVGSQLFPGIFAGRVQLTKSETDLLTPKQLTLIREAHFTRLQLDQLLVPGESRGDRLAKMEQAESLLVNPPPVWPVALAAAGFLYLWWLGSLIFDLSFVWHRYVRGSVTNSRLAEWAFPEHKEKKLQHGGAESCRNPQRNRTPDKAPAGATPG